MGVAAGGEGELLVRCCEGFLLDNGGISARVEGFGFGDGGLDELGEVVDDGRPGAFAELVQDHGTKVDPECILSLVLCVGGQGDRVEGEELLDGGSEGWQGGEVLQHLRRYPAVHQSEVFDVVE